MFELLNKWTPLAPSSACRRLLSCSTLVVAYGALLLTTASADQVSFQHDVLPLLSDRCFHCHGPDESNREADLRLDLDDLAKADRGGYAAIVPGDPEASVAFQRVISDDADLVMPPQYAHREPLSKDEVEVLRKWIESGAEWGKHWAFEKIQRPEPPSEAPHPIDAFVRRRLAQAGLQPASQAAPHTLARRASFDLTGLPPTSAQTEELERGALRDSFAELVDQLLASPSFGERMAMWWLDCARYSDTDGFQQDETRNNWPWRDWVIEAFNKNMPFDQFTIEQFAGDLLPDATEEQKLATCFHRNHQTNGEGGRDREESRVDYVIDRANTTGTVWLGLTLGCCQCHSHKFDPISQKEYYQFTAFFNSIDETGAAGKKADPYLSYESSHVDEIVDKARELAKSREATRRKQAELAEPAFQDWLAERFSQTREGHSSWRPLAAETLRSAKGTQLTQLDDASILASGKNPNKEFYTVVAPAGKRPITAIRLEILAHESNTLGRLSRNETGQFVLTGFKLQLRQVGKAQVRDVEIARAAADLEQKADDEKYGAVSGILHDDPRNGWTVSAEASSESHVAVLYLDEPLQLASDEQFIIHLAHASYYQGANIGRFRLSVTSDPPQVLQPARPTPLERLAQLEATSAEEIPADLKNELRRHFLFVYPPYLEAAGPADLAQEQLKKVEALQGEVQVMVLEERQKSRKTFVLERGVWDQHREQVNAGVPQAVLPWSQDRTETRLDLAKWIVSSDNPLTARVVANQLWQICFGKGLVRTPEDFGLQGERPTHPQLLDWLSAELIDSGWDVKHMLRLIMTSETYQQASDYTPDLLERDPKNKLLARGARFRLPSWMIRDAALAHANLLDDSLGGPPVMPYQPQGVWEALLKGKHSYDTSQGPLQFRRTLYAFWRRSSAPTYLFDIAPRRICEVRLRRTNTPLHALTLMNDLGQLEAARALAKELIATESDPDQRIANLCRRVLSRRPDGEELSVLREQLEDWIELYTQSPEKAEQFLDFGQPELLVEEKLPETAAYTVLASLVLNLDEAITRE